VVFPPPPRRHHPPPYTTATDRSRPPDRSRTGRHHPSNPACLALMPAATGNCRNPPRKSSILDRFSLASISLLRPPNRTCEVNMLDLAPRVLGVLGPCRVRRADKAD
ncbi:unnamed protein product, partial [Prunus brigantina]